MADESFNMDSVILCQGAKEIILSEEHPGVVITSGIYSKLRASSATSTVFIRKLLGHFFDTKKLAESNRSSLIEKHKSIMEAIIRNYYNQYLLILIFRGHNERVPRCESFKTQRGHHLQMCRGKDGDKAKKIAFCVQFI